MIMNGKGHDIDEFMIHLEVENVLKTRDNGMRIIDEWIWGEQVNEHDVKLTLQQKGNI